MHEKYNVSYQSPEGHGCHTSVQVIFYVSKKSRVWLNRPKNCQYKNWVLNFTKVFVNLSTKFFNLQWLPKLEILLHHLSEPAGTMTILSRTSIVKSFPLLLASLSTCQLLWHPSTVHHLRCWGGNVKDLASFTQLSLFGCKIYLPCFCDCSATWSPAITWAPLWEDTGDSCKL